MKTRSYRFGDLRKQLRESTSEFKPVFGKGVESTEKDLNRKAYQDIAKETKDYNKSVNSPKKNDVAASVNDHINLGMSDLEYDTTPSKQFSDNAKAGYEGYTSALDKKNHKDEELANGSRNPELAQALVQKAKDNKEKKDSFSEVGITNIQKPKDATHLHQAVVESSKTSLLKFKHVQFISESHMLSHVPDEYKVEGKRFYMQDCKGNRYLVEWHAEPGIEKQINESSINAEMSRIKELFSYNGKNNRTTNSIRINENNRIEDMLQRTRSLMK